MKILYFGYDFEGPLSGGNLVKRNNFFILKEIYGNNLISYFVNTNISNCKIISDFLKLNYKGQKKEHFNSICNLIEENNCEIIFFESSLFGNLQKKIKKKFPQIKIVTFFHNVEIKYYIERVKVEGKFRIFILPSIFYNEKCTLKYSDKIILLNNRDKEKLEAIYELKKKFHIIPIFLDENIENNIEAKNGEEYLLFIGSLFYANEYAVKWFIENVVPYIKKKFVIVGYKMEKFKYLENEQIKVIGTVKNLEKYYFENNIIVSPIFHGSGMKTKTIEALKYGKTIIGTPEAFIGIDEEIIKKVGYCCKTKNEFIEQINSKFPLKKDAKKIKEIFDDNFSRNKALKKYKEVLTNW